VADCINPTVNPVQAAGGDATRYAGARYPGSFQLGKGDDAVLPRGDRGDLGVGLNDLFPHTGNKPSNTLIWPPGGAAGERVGLPSLPTVRA
jgi:hypothetical protein